MMRIADLKQKWQTTLSDLHRSGYRFAILSDRQLYVLVESDFPFSRYIEMPLPYSSPCVAFTLDDNHAQTFMYINWKRTEIIIPYA
jgi:hypothetical protein